MTIINDKDPDVVLDHSFQVIFNKINNWISARLGQMIKSVDGDYVH